MSQMIHPSKMELRLSCLLPPKFYSSRRNQKPHSTHMKALLLKWAIYWTIDYTIYEVRLLIGLYSPVAMETKVKSNPICSFLFNETCDWVDMLQ